MKICFNQATTMKKSTLVKDLVFCEKYGYLFIEIRLDKLCDYLSRNNQGDLVDFFSNSKIKPYAVNALEFITFRDKADFQVIKDNLRFLCETGSKIGCKKIVVVPSFDIGGYTKTQKKKESVRALNELAELAKPYGIKLAYEFVGYPNCSVRNTGIGTSKRPSELAKRKPGWR
jgi:2-keto-myo-inositol isomerase